MLKCPHDPGNTYDKEFCEEIRKTGHRPWCQTCPHFEEKTNVANQKQGDS